MADITQIFFSFQECCFWRVQPSQFEKDTFSKKKIAIEVLCMHLPYVKRYSQEYQ